MIIPMPRRVAGAVEAEALAPAGPALNLWREAVALGAGGRHAEAVDAWRAVLQASPDDAEAAHQLGLALVALGRHGEAIGSFERALHHAPASRLSKIALARALLAAGRLNDARFNFEDALVHEPGDVVALTGQAACLRRLGRPGDALTVAERAAARAADDAEPRMEQALSLVDLDRKGEAIELLHQVCEKHASHVEAARLLARLLQEEKRFAEAAGHLRRAAAQQPESAAIWQELGCALRGARADGESIEAFRRALWLQPGLAAAHANMAMVLADVGRLDDALASVDRALSIEPDSRTVRFTKGCIHLTRGEFAQGWEHYEFRFSKDGKKGLREDTLAAPWLGESLAGRTFLALGEQASGDYIQFSRYLPALAALGAEVTFFTPGRLQRLFAGLTGPVEVITGLSGGGRFDYQCHLMSLPHRFLRCGLPIPTAPWLSSEPGRRSRWQERIGDHGFRVGVAWRGSNNDHRSFAPAHLAPLASVPGVRLISLLMESDAPSPIALPPGLAIENLGQDFDTGEDGFLDAAAVIDGLDLVVSCDTSIAHLAGALGKPTWIALNTAPEWRWQRGSTTSVWYPAARLFRQRTFGDWDGVLREMAAELAQLVSSGRPLPAR